jgi:putative ABC transport system substrate-binding protein
MPRLTVLPKPVWLRGIITVCRLTVLLASLANFPAHASQRVTLLLSEPGGIYQEAAQALQRELDLDPGQWTVRLRNVDAAPLANGDEDGLVVALGVRALQYALSAQSDGPLLALLVPRTSFEKLMSGSARRGRNQPTFALYVDQPIARQLQLIRLALPEARRVGVLLGPTTEGQSDDLRKAAHEAGLEMRIRHISGPDQLFYGLKDMSRGVDALLLVPDPLVVDRKTLKILFLESYRQQLPIAAYSPGLVGAGALLGLYTTPAQQGIEAGKWIKERPWDEGGRLGETRYPRLFAVEVNRNVARSLELTVSAGETLTTRLEKEGGQ